MVNYINMRMIFTIGKIKEILAILFPIQYHTTDI